MFVPSPTVSAGWLEAHLDAVTIVDTRWYLDGRFGRAAYDAGHIPGAVFLDLDHDLSAPPSAVGGRHPLPAPAAFAEALARVGIGDHTPVVVYDDGGGSVAARLWWLLRSLGDKVAVLDGGVGAWCGPLVRDSVPSTRAQRTPRPWPETHFVDIDAVDELRSDPAVLLLDARSASRYEAGDPALDPRPGHIPGARSAPWLENLDPLAPEFLPRVELRRRYEALGVADADVIVAYCGSGVTACHDLLALELAGFSNTKLFPGSWSAWGADDRRPAETGGHVLGTSTITS